MILSHSLFSVLKEEDWCKSYSSRRIKNLMPVPIYIGINNVNEDVKFLIQR